MSTNKYCLLCGKPVEEGQEFCEDCRDHMENQYATDFLDNKPDVVQPEDENEKPEDIEPEEHQPVEETEVEQSGSEPTKKGMSKAVIFILMGCFILVAIGVVGTIKVIEQRESEEKELKFWNKSVDENTVLSYSKYLVTYRNGKFVDEANERIRKIRKEEIAAWEKLKKSSDLNAFYAYISENPKTPYLSQIRDIMDSLTWVSTLKDDSADAYKAYLENVKLENISGKHVDEANERYQYLSSIVVVEGASLESLKLDLDDFFKKLAQNNQRELLKEFTSSVYYYTGKKTATEIVADITKERKDDKVKKITYNPIHDSLYAKRDNQGIVFAELSVKSVTSFNVRKKKDETDTLSLLIELDKDKKIRSIKTKNNTTNGTQTRNN
ncbi:hypothetical protein [Dysgonomonas macrotermitis]|uniref:Zinc-ribbon domain-containing protein n=1 Tax=Dysgonomonas macrotermitis TaxID=1346286 RepID=A0A1M5FSB8_9BACT|nr:hypothetical protein [Dysgonomonas macrotermitis]SHF94082.1 hypothetical protein SAMN05444362_11287 [Dysgonomonas macrotermitis]